MSYKYELADKIRLEFPKTKIVMTEVPKFDYYGHPVEIVSRRALRDTFVWEVAADLKAFAKERGRAPKAFFVLDVEHREDLAFDEVMVSTAVI